MPDHPVHRPTLAARRGRPRISPESSAPTVRVEVRLPRDVAADIYAAADRDNVTVSRAVADVWRRAMGRGAVM